MASTSCCIPSLVVSPLWCSAEQSKRYCDVLKIAQSPREANSTREGEKRPDGKPAFDAVDGSSARHVSAIEVGPAKAPTIRRSYPCKPLRQLELPPVAAVRSRPGFLRHEVSSKNRRRFILVTRPDEPR
jgi:hypothetical protein